MARRIYGNGPIASVAHVQTVETILGQIRIAFVPKQDPFEELAREIEKCSRKIWQCVGDKESYQRQPKKARTDRADVSASSGPSKSPVRPNRPNDQISSNGLSRFKFETELNAMKYQDLKNECKKYGLKCNGTKAALRDRLVEHVFDDVKVDPEAAEPMQVEEVVDRPQTRNVCEDVEMRDVSASRAKNVEPEPSPAEPVVEKEPARVSISSMQALSDGMLPVAGTKEQEVSKDPPGKAAPDTMSVGPVNSVMKSPLASYMKDALKNMEQSVPKSTSQPPKDSIPEDDISPPPSDLTSSTTSSKMGPRVRELISSLSNHSGASNSALSKSVQAKKEARMARLAEVREKSQQAKIFSASKPVLASKECSSTVTNLNATIASTGASKKNLAAQMREKALRKENVPGNHNYGTTSSSSAAKRAFPISHAVVPDSLGTTLKTGLGLKNGLSAAKKVKTPPKPMETYEISDREDSDSDDSEAENEKNKKKIPAWAVKDMLLPALEAQYNGCIEGRRVDPDMIFSEVETCNLEAIFGKKMNAKYRTRTSSGNWSRDQVTAAEKLVYKRAMGFAGAEECNEI